MKKIRILFISLVINIFFTPLVFSEGAFEFCFNVPLGAGVGFFDGEYKEGIDKAESDRKNALNVGAGFEWGITMQIGYLFVVAENMGVSALFDFGYHHDIFAYTAKRDLPDGNYALTLSTKNKKVNESYYFEMIQIGVLPKFNLNNISIGLGAGIKIPITGIHYTENSYYNAATGIYNADKLIPITELITFDNAKNDFKTAVIPYIKLTFDYAFFVDTKTAVTLGIYAGYDFGIDMNLTSKDSKYNQLAGTFNKYTLSSFDIGAQIGLRFAYPTI